MSSSNPSIPSGTFLNIPNNKTENTTKSTFGSMSKKNIIIGSVIALVVAGLVGYFVLRKKKVNVNLPTTPPI